MPACGATRPASPGRAAQGEVELDPGDLEEALRAASAIGDDRLQKLGTGRVMPEKFTHGTLRAARDLVQARLRLAAIRGSATPSAMPARDSRKKPGVRRQVRSRIQPTAKKLDRSIVEGPSRAPCGAWRGPP